MNGRTVATRHECTYQFLAAAMLQINCDALFIRIQMEEQPAFFRMRLIARKGASLSCRVATVRPFNLDDFGAVRRQQFGAVGSGDMVREVQHGDVC